MFGLTEPGPTSIEAIAFLDGRFETEFVAHALLWRRQDLALAGVTWAPRAVGSSGLVRGEVVSDPAVRADVDGHRRGAVSMLVRCRGTRLR